MIGLEECSYDLHQVLRTRCRSSIVIGSTVRAQVIYCVSAQPSCGYYENMQGRIRAPVAICRLGHGWGCELIFFVLMMDAQMGMTSLFHFRWG